MWSMWNMSRMWRASPQASRSVSAWRRDLRLGIARLIDCLLPDSCILCLRDSTRCICPDCTTQFLTCDRPRCPQCARPLPGNSVAVTSCGACLSHPPAFDCTITAVDYLAPIDRIVMALKYGGKPGIGRPCADAIWTALKQHHSLPDLLCPVPLGPKRLAQRGYNQALELARPLSQMSAIPLHAALMVRVRETEAQAMLAARLRHRNIKSAFTLMPEAIPLVSGAHVGVIDDVMTTGATLAEVAATLKRFGASRVTNIVFARTPP